MKRSSSIQNIIVTLTVSIAFFYCLSTAGTDAQENNLLQTRNKYTPAQLAIAEAQAKKMLSQLPEMSRLVTNGDLMWSWTVRQFAGDAAGENIIWSSASTVSPDTIRGAVCKGKLEVQLLQHWV